MIVGEELDKRYAGDSRGRKANKMEAHEVKEFKTDECANHMFQYIVVK